MRQPDLSLDTFTDLSMNHPTHTPRDVVDGIFEHEVLDFIAQMIAAIGDNGAIEAALRLWLNARAEAK